MIDFLDLASGVAAGFGVIMAIYIVVCHGEKMSFPTRLGLMVLCAVVILNTPRQFFGWTNAPGDDWAYVLTNVGIALFIWAKVWPQVKKSTHLFSR